MPQFVVRYKSRLVYPGSAMPGAIIRGYDSRFFNASNFHIPFGRLTAYGSVGRAQGRLIPLIPQTKDNLVFRDAGISIMPDTYQHFNDELYIEESRGYKPGQPVSILEKGDIWLPLWKDVFKFQLVSVKNKINAFSVSQAKKDIKKIGLFSNETGTGNKKIEGAYWLTDGKAGSIALARIEQPLDPGDPIIDLSGDGNDF